MSPPASTGTSELNKLCFTDDMSSCIAAAIGGMSPDRKNAKIRVFHFMAGNANESARVVEDHLGALRSQGLTSVTAALHGGSWSGSDADSESGPILSNELAQRLRSTFRRQGVNVVLDEACDRRTRETPLGAVIVPGARDGEVQVKFVTHITSDHLPDDDVLRLYEEEDED
ncbi:hypothetical protein GWC77_23030 [Paraburkholderia sp. NMBU_R16]|uniref:hypothetical protein n=1 Tax=Paraburkholderia sp. NMBU_R16 TaxID=2698676 RepID=UPI0015678C55|nr:hypothetical protein [Paraburkholderia sp. NMBU_R16]NRO98793.1 hypothetical protein [Paraburkholderia sp. NMBU_R16]